LAFARSFREATYRIFAAVAASETPQPGDLDMLNTLLNEALLRLRIVARDGRFVWEWAVDPGALHQVLWPVAYSAARLLTSDDVQWVGQCADDRGCGFLFVDTSKNHTRRWCGVGCANRAKAQRHYARVKDARED
jgi:predicted RNA-binding Zn ribbon-like protein